MLRRGSALFFNPVMLFALPYNAFSIPNALLEEAGGKFPIND